MLTWTLLRWEELGRDDLYDALTLRQLVFSVEQSCAYLDCDGVDRRAAHLLGRASGVGAVADGTLVAYARIVEPGAAYEEPAIGRVVTHASVRRAGMGRALMREAIARTEAIYGPAPVRIGAQRYLERFYRSFGFEVASAPYDEDGIPHVQMLRAARPPATS